MKDYNTNLASEYFVLSLLYRMEFDAYITLGNKKAIDIIIRNEETLEFNKSLEKFGNILKEHNKNKEK